MCIPGAGGFEPPLPGDEPGRCHLHTNNIINVASLPALTLPRPAAALAFGHTLMLTSKPEHPFLGGLRLTVLLRTSERQDSNLRVRDQFAALPLRYVPKCAVSPKARLTSTITRPMCFQVSTRLIALVSTVGGFVLRPHVYIRSNVKACGCFRATVNPPGLTREGTAAFQ